MICDVVFFRQFFEHSKCALTGYILCAGGCIGIQIHPSNGLAVGIHKDFCRSMIKRHIPHDFQMVVQRGFPALCGQSPRGFPLSETKETVCRRALLAHRQRKGSHIRLRRDIPCRQGDTHSATLPPVLSFLRAAQSTAFL